LFLWGVFGRIVWGEGGVGWNGKERAVQGSLDVTVFSAYWVVYSDKEYSIINQQIGSTKGGKPNPSRNVPST
jgi:hypothetical protein